MYDILRLLWGPQTHCSHTRYMNSQDFIAYNCWLYCVRTSKHIICDVKFTFCMFVILPCCFCKNYCKSFVYLYCLFHVQCCGFWSTTQMHTHPFQQPVLEPSLKSCIGHVRATICILRCGCICKQSWHPDRYLCDYIAMFCFLSKCK